jgi:histone acetyltransferase
MDEAESRRRGLTHLVPKRTASEDPNGPPDTKRVKEFHDGSTEPDVQPSATTWVFFPQRRYARITKF